MTWQVVRLEDAVATPWRNGGGVTRELAAWPSSTDWTWRMSVAEIGQSGPFSTFDGVDRWFAVLAGSGVQLIVDQQTHHLTAAQQPFFFDGAACTNCQLTDGATQDFNLMVQRSRVSARMVHVSNRLHIAIDMTSGATKIIAVYAINSRATVVFNDEKLQLPAAGLAWCVVGGQARIHITARNALWMEISL